MESDTSVKSAEVLKHPLEGVCVGPCDAGTTVKLRGGCIVLLDDEGGDVLVLTIESSAAILSLVPENPTVGQLAPAMRVLDDHYRAYEFGMRRGKKWGREEMRQEIYRHVHGLLGLDKIVEALSALRPL